MYYIDVEDAHGVKLGAGPIITSLDWTYTSRLDAAGTFAFTMPRDDPRANLLQPKRTVRAWTYAAGAYQPLGAGIINDISTAVSNDGRALLNVSGDNLLSELLDRIVPDLHLVDRRYEHAAEVFYVPDSSAIDGGDDTTNRTWLDYFSDYSIYDTTTHHVFDDNMEYRWLIIRHPLKFRELRFTVKIPSVTGSPSYTLQYWQGAAWADISSHATPAGIFWGAADYRITLDDDPPADWTIRAGEANYKLRLKPLGLETGRQVSDMVVLCDYPDTAALAKVMAYAPSGWALDVANGYPSISQATALGNELITNGGFETHTGTFDDNTADEFIGWTTANESGTSIVQATATADSGAAAAKITVGDIYATPRLVQDIPVQESAQYMLTARVRGDGANGPLFWFGDPEQTTYITPATFTNASATDYVTHTSYITVPAGWDTVRLTLCGVWYTILGTGYWDNVSFKRRIGGECYLELAGESVLESLIRIAEQTGEHFIESPAGKQILWLRNDRRDSGMRAIGYADAYAAEGHRDICLIQSLNEAATGSDLISRVYPYGGGTGAERITLADCTRTAPDGYVLNKTENYLERTASSTAYGRIERRLDYPEIVRISGAENAFAANALFDLAYAHLRKHSATNLALDGGDAPRTYNLQLLKCDRMLLPGYTLRLQYSRYVNGIRTMHIDDDYWILSSTIRADANGVRTVSVQCSNVDAATMTDDMLIAEMLRRQRAMAAHD